MRIANWQLQNVGQCAHDRLRNRAALPGIASRFVCGRRFLTMHQHSPIEQAARCRNSRSPPHLIAGRLFQPGRSRSAGHGCNAGTGRREGKSNSGTKTEVDHHRLPDGRGESSRHVRHETPTRGCDPGEFQPIKTAVAGLHVCEHLPLLAARAKKYALIRTLSHGDNNHLMSTHHVLTGTKQPGGFFDKVASRDDWPSYSSALAYLRPRRDGIPSGVNLPTFLLQGPLTWPGQHAGFLGAKYDPWQITGDPEQAQFPCRRFTTLPGNRRHRG